MAIVYLSIFTRAFILRKKKTSKAIHLMHEKCLLKVQNICQFCNDTPLIDTVFYLLFRALPSHEFLRFTKITTKKKRKCVRITQILINIHGRLEFKIFFCSLYSIMVAVSYFVLLLYACDIHTKPVYMRCWHFNFIFRCLNVSRFHFN